VQALLEEPAIQTGGSAADVRSGDLDLMVSVTMQDDALKVTLLHNSTLPRSERALSWAKDQLRDVTETRESELAEASGLSADSFGVWTISSEDVSEARDRTRSMLSEVMPMMLVIMLMIATVSPAVDIFVGERERGTLETSLVCAKSRWPLIIGKILAASVIGILGVLGNLVAGSISLLHFFQQIGGPQTEGLGLEAGPMLLALVPVASGALLICAATFLVIIPARTFKQAQSLSSWIFIVFIGLVYTGESVEGTPEFWTALVPGRNIMHCLSEGMLGSLTPGYSLTAAGINLALGMVTVVLVHRIMGHESYLFGPENSGWRDALKSLLPRRAQ
jgi:sodium transport system permease protein